MKQQKSCDKIATGELIKDDFWTIIRDKNATWMPARAKLKRQISAFLDASDWEQK